MPADTALPLVSIALGTYNGGQYLREQLESIAAQQRPPDELVICDDCSGDDSVEIVRWFAARASFPVRLQINERRLGSTGNFAKAIALCRGRWIFLCDQDDVWMPQKIARLLQAAAEHPDAGLLFSDVRLVDAARRPLGCGLWEALRFGRRQQRLLNRGDAWKVLVRRNVVTGMTMAFRSEYRPWVLPPAAGWVHDGWIALIVAAVAPCVAIAEPLVEYRQHPGQQIGEKKRNLYQMYLRAKEKGSRDFSLIADNYRAAHDRLFFLRGELRDPQILAALAEKDKHYRARIRMRAAGNRLRTVWEELRRRHYWHYSSGWKSLAQDLFC